ncbi:class I SAM-dependent methyltransferase [Actomonas aquatica]|uniref:Class I SAM-dependent methyltransferase n=1 Tax=Actomonas aquatica TaxID=2866162 RepID=A0ABZ1C2C2_9BACT|nr:class I SAM-dependent methyltransferase [Opitutus sp. WL0086]WRQ85596.1 class I SAM-dependent methyltransferase [Opitutus sp. WL0086]
MRLWHNKTVWEKLAREDPYWAVLTLPDTTGNRWEIEQFFATGRENVDTDLTYIAGQRPDLRREHALDFGCGVGRLSQALADHFAQVTGIDIAAPMIELAQKHNQHGERVRYVHNPASDLRCLPDASFDLVYSVITLQHIPTALIRGYLREFLRVCRPGGAIYFQLPAEAPVQPWRFSWYPPTLWMRFKRWFRKAAAIDPEMVMNALPKAEVIALLEKHGGTVIDTRPDHAAGDLESWSYLVTKK